MDDTIQKQAIGILLDAARSGGEETVLLNSQVALRDLFSEDRDSCQRFTDLLGAMRSIHITHQQARDAERQTEGADNEKYRSELLSKARNILATTFQTFANGLAGENLTPELGGLAKRLQAHSLLEGAVSDSINACVAQVEANKKVLADAAAHKADVQAYLDLHKKLSA